MILPSSRGPQFTRSSLRKLLAREGETKKKNKENEGARGNLSHALEFSVAMWPLPNTRCNKQNIRISDMYQWRVSSIRGKHARTTQHAQISHGQTTHPNTNIYTNAHIIHIHLITPNSSQARCKEQCPHIHISKDHMSMHISHAHLGVEGCMSWPEGGEEKRETPTSSYTAGTLTLMIPAGQ